MKTPMTVTTCTDQEQCRAVLDTLEIREVLRPIPPKLVTDGIVQLGAGCWIVGTNDHGIYTLHLLENASKEEAGNSSTTCAVPNGVIQINVYTSVAQEPQPTRKAIDMQTIQIPERLKSRPMFQGVPIPFSTFIRPDGTPDFKVMKPTGASVLVTAYVASVVKKSNSITSRSSEAKRRCNRPCSSIHPCTGNALNTRLVCVRSLR